MAFWKKSEDPWDMDPADKRRFAPAEEEAETAGESPLDMLKNWAVQKRAAEVEKLTLSPEKCPWCGRDMEQGYLSGGKSVFWHRGVLDTRTKWLGAGKGNTLRVDDEGVFVTCKTAWHCPDCEKIVFSSAGLRAPYESEPPTESPYTGAFGETAEKDT